MDTASRISEIVRKRNESVVPLRKEREKCAKALSALESLESILSGYVDKGDKEDLCVRNSATFLANIPEIRKQVMELQNSVSCCCGRFERKTVNIGFGGKKGMGKSYLLQKLSGLSDNEVPSGKGLPVTAVSSQIVNDATSYADVSFYDEKDFLRQIIQPYCDALGLSTPATIADFALLKMPELKKGDITTPYANRLAEIKRHLPEYRDLLKGHTERINLADIRKYVAYTDRRDKNTWTWLAVREARIHTPFPRTDVRQLGLIDLPGLGEMNPSVEKRHTRGFEDEVDIVLLIKRPAGTRADWDDADQNALEVLKNGVRDIDPVNFVVLVQNDGGCDPEMARLSLEAMRKAHPDYKILETHGETAAQLSTDILDRTLDILAASLPESDREAQDKIMRTSVKLWAKLGKYCDELRELLNKGNDRGYGDEVFDEKTASCLKDLSVGLYAEEKRLDRYARATSADAPLPVENGVAGEGGNDLPDTRLLYSNIDRIMANLREYIHSGMGHASVDAWVKNNAPEIILKGNAAGILTDNSNDLRVKIAEEFTHLDVVYRDIVDELLNNVSNQFDAVFPGLLPEGTGREKLRYLRERIENSDYGMSELLGAINSLLDLKIEYYTQFYPRVYEPIRAFRELVKKPDLARICQDGEDMEGQARLVFEVLEGQAESVLMDIENLMNGETAYLYNILLVALEYFNDRILRHRDAVRHWRRFVKTFYPEIWGSPQEAEANVAINTVLSQLKDLRQLCNA